MKISVIIPVYNVAPYLAQALDSLCVQTHKEWEAICVDDGSTDGSSDILTNYAASDGRLKVFRQSNLGTLVARKRAVAMASGDYCLFLDPDDWLEPEALKILSDELTERPVDIFQYGAIIRETSARSDKARNVTEHFFNRDVSDKTGSGILKSIFIDRTMGWGVITRLVSIDMARKAFAAMPDVHMVNSTDLLAMFFVALYAESYRRIPTRLYNYRYGCGISTSPNLTPEAFAVASRKLYVLEPVREFVARNLPDDALAARALGEIDGILVDSTLTAFYRRLPNDDVRARALDAVQSRRDVHHVAMTYHWLGVGGVQNVIVSAARSLIDLGYKVSFLTETPIPKDGFTLLPEVEVVVIPQSSKLLGYDRVARRNALRSVIVERKIDLVYTHAYNSVALEDDAVTCRLICGIPFVVHFHNSFSVYYLSDVLRRRLPDVTRGLMLATMVITLSRTDELYFSLQGIRTKYVPNPVKVPSREGNARSSNLIVWCGRISEVKRPIEAIRAFARVLDRVRDARLCVLGDGDRALVESVHAEACRLHVGDAVEFAGFTSEPRDYYRRAKVFLSTSQVEGFPMAISEALSEGLPVVAYAMPYLELFADNAAVFQVDQMDSGAAAGKLADLLELTPPEFESISRSAIDSVRRFASIDFGKELQALFANLNDFNRGVECGPSRENANMSYIVSVMREAACRPFTCGSHSKVRGNYTGHGVLPKKVVGLVLCLEENGWRYTVRHALGKMLRFAGFTCGW